MADIARHVGVSRPLVSIVLRGVDGASEATRQRVLAAAAELGYRPDALAQGLRSQRTRRLGVTFDLRRPFEVEFVERMLPVVKRLGYHLLLGATAPDRAQEAVIEELLGYRCEALIVLGPEARDERSTVEVPVVAVGGSGSRGSVDVIRNDDALGTGQAVDHLVDLGHRSITYIDGGANPGAADRTAGYRTAMTQHRLSREIRIVAGGYTEEDGANAAQTLLADRLPTAVIASNDMCAIGLLDGVLRAGKRVPEDLSVVGYDDSRFARLPGIDLTSVRQDIPQMAELAVQAAVECLDLPTHTPKQVALSPRLVIRGTTSPPQPRRGGRRKPAR
jgi:DNA-binding LacI/PurR family transcriptional regulator